MGCNMEIASRTLIKSAIIVFLLALFGLEVAAAKSVTAVALFNDKAMIIVDDSKAKIVRAGSTYQGVKLISSNTDKAVIEVDGERQELVLDGTVLLSGSLGNEPSAAYGRSITLYENELGFFEHAGAVNGQSLNFLVDTGANLVVLSSAQAEKIGLDYKDGFRSFATTASGTAPMYGVTLDEISLGGIKLRNIEAGVIVGNFPKKSLLGMTFLSKLDMNRSGNKMVLKRR